MRWPTTASAKSRCRRRPSGSGAPSRTLAAPEKLPSPKGAPILDPVSRGAAFVLSLVLTALVAMFLQQTFASVGKVLPAVIAPLVLAELAADPAWVGVYFCVTAGAALVAHMGCGSFIIKYRALPMNQAALLLLGRGMAAAAGSGPPGLRASAGGGG